jgi:fermentation-respiration switch protein FrsA (DUF1100 family)
MWLFLLGAILLYGLVVAGVYAIQRSLLYFPDASRPAAGAVGLAGLREVETATADGLRLLAWYLPPPEGASVIVYLHGNGGSIANRADRLRHFATAGFGALFVEYRGYGGNPGAPTEAGLLADARAGLDFLAAQGVAPERTILFGESLGTGIAVRMAGERPVALLILESPYTSIAAVAQWHYPLLPARFLIKDRFDALSRIGAVKAPLLVLQGARDEVVPPRLGQALFAAAAEPKEIWVAPQGNHNDLGGFGAVTAALDFIRRHDREPQVTTRREAP